jgi:plastocyanin
MRRPLLSSALRGFAPLLPNTKARATCSAAACWFAAVLCACAAAAPPLPQASPVTGRIELVAGKAGKQAAGHASGGADASNVVVWLTPLDASTVSAPPQAARTPQLVQQNKSFEPHVLVIEVGSMVAFPNKDPFFHNVFSLYDGKRFDLGLYEAGTSRSVRFARPGVSFLFCNIHPEMSAVVVAVETPYFALSDRAGNVSIPNVPDGRYQMHVWYERSSLEDLKAAERVVVISGSTRAVGTIPLIENGDFKLAHKNKYGQDYVPPAATAY